MSKYVVTTALSGLKQYMSKYVVTTALSGFKTIYVKVRSNYSYKG